MAEYKCKIVGGYSGKHGSLTASRMFTFPFVPIKNLGITLDGLCFSLGLIEERDDDFLTWEASYGQFHCMATDMGDAGPFHDAKSIDEIATWYLDHGWSIEDVDKEVLACPTN